jgi:hypothetical protein
MDLGGWFRLASNAKEAYRLSPHSYFCRHSFDPGITWHLFTLFL